MSYPNFSYLGADLTPQTQKQLTKAQARLVIVQDKIAVLTAIVNDPATKPDKKKSAAYWLKIRQAELVKLQTLIAKLTSTPAPPPIVTVPPEVTPVDPYSLPVVPMTPVWHDPTSALPSNGYVQEGGGVVTQPVTETITTWTIPPLVIVGGVVMLILFGRRRAPA